MLDLAGITFSSLMMLIIITRAVQLDRSRPWFQKVKRRDDAAAAAGKRRWPFQK